MKKMQIIDMSTLLIRRISNRKPFYLRLRVLRHSAMNTDF